MLPRPEPATSRSGVAMFAAIFVMIIIGLLAMQFHYMTRQAQSSAHRFQTSEMARQLAAAAIEEAFMYVHNESENSGGAFFNNLVKRAGVFDASTTSLENKNQKGVAVPIALTLAQAAAMPMGSRMNIDATARIIDFRNVDSSGAQYYEQEGIGTLELRVVVEPKAEFKKQIQGACTITRHHDYKVVSIVSRRDNNSQRTAYAGGYILDYAIFLRDGQEEFASPPGLSLNPVAHKLTIDQTGLTAENCGKLYFGNRRNNFVYLNIDSARNDFIPEPRKKEKILEVDDQTVFKLLPKFEAMVRAEAEKAVKKEGASLAGFSMTGHKAYFEYSRHPITDEALAPIKDMKDFRDVTLAGEAKINKQKEAFEFYPGLVLKPDTNLENMLEGDLRQRYFHFGYFYVDLSNCQIYVKAKKKVMGKTKTKSVTMPINDAGMIATYKNRHLPCFDADHIPEMPNDFLNQRYIKDNIANALPDVLCRIDKENRYLKASNTSLPHPAFFNFRNSGSLEDPTMASVPFARVNLWARRNVSLKQLEEFGIYQPAAKKLNLRGIIQLSEAITLGAGGDIEVEGCGVIVAPGITIAGGIKKKAGTDSVCILMTRGHPITVNTTSLIEAALVSIGGSNRNGYVVANKQLNLKGCLAADRLNITRWQQGVEHRIQYDPSFKRNEDLYQVNLSRWVTFERMVEQDE